MTIITHTIYDELASVSLLSRSITLSLSRPFSSSYLNLPKWLLSQFQWCKLVKGDCILMSLVKYLQATSVLFPVLASHQIKHIRVSTPLLLLLLLTFSIDNDESIIVTKECSSMKNKCLKIQPKYELVWYEFWRLIRKKEEDLFNKYSRQIRKRIRIQNLRIL